MEMDFPSANDAQPLISVIITSYNYGHYISESIASVLRQDFPSFELIVVDNASTDTTDEIVQPFLADPRFRYIKNDVNIGLAPNHNRGLAFARGRFINFVSADDKLLPGHLRRCYDFLALHPATDMVYCGVIFINAESLPYGVRAMSGQLPVDYDGGRNELAAQLAEGCYIPWPSMLARRALYDELGGLDNMTGADYEITVRWAAARKTFAYLRTPSSCIRLHGPQASGAAYVKDGRDLTDYITMLERSVTPETADLIGQHSGAISRHLVQRGNWFRQFNDGALPAGLAPRYEEMLARLADVPRPTLTDDLHGRPLISVIARVENVLGMMRTLGTIAAQEDAPPWEVIVVGEGGPDFGPLLQTLPDAGRIRFVRMDERGPAGGARNLGIRLASGRIITYCEPGTTYTPKHFANLYEGFKSGARVVRTGTRYLLGTSQDGTPNTVTHEMFIQGFYRDGNDEDRDLVAPGVPIDAIAHFADAIDAIGLWRTDIPCGESWEFWLRLRHLGHAYVHDASADVRTIRERVLPDARMVAVAQSIYRAYPVSNGSPLVARRGDYLANLTAVLERGPAAVADENSAIATAAMLAGIQNAVFNGPAASQIGAG